MFKRANNHDFGINISSKLNEIQKNTKYTLTE